MWSKVSGVSESLQNKSAVWLYYILQHWMNISQLSSPPLIYNFFLVTLDNPHCSDRNVNKRWEFFEDKCRSLTYGATTNYVLTLVASLRARDGLGTLPFRLNSLKNIYKLRSLTFFFHQHTSSRLCPSVRVRAHLTYNRSPLVTYLIYLYFQMVQPTLG